MAAEQQGDWQDDNGRFGPGGSTGWTDIKARVPELEDAPFGLYLNIFKSSSPDSERFIHDPKELLGGENGIVAREPAHIHTIVLNHERTLERMNLYAFAVVDEEEDTASLVLYKQEPTY